MTIIKRSTSLPLDIAGAGARRALHLLLILFFLFSSRTMSAIDPHSRITQYSHTAWQTPEGILSRPDAVTQTTDGYIWVATHAGLFRFDGVKFTEWKPPANQRSPGRGIQHLLGARDGSLWIGTQSGLSRWKDGQLTYYMTDPREPGISGLIEDHDGKIWVTRYRIYGEKRTLCLAKKTTLECYGKNEGVPAKYALGIAEDSAGNLWYGCQALCRWNHHSTTTYLDDQLQHPSGEGVQDVAIANGEVWASIEEAGPKLGLRHFSNGKWSSYIVSGFDSSKIGGANLFVDKSQTLWIGASDGIYHLHDGIADHYGVADGLTANGVDSFYEDREGNLWVCTDQGLDMFRDQKVTTFSKNQGLAGEVVTSVLTIDGDSLWVGDMNGLSVIHAGPIASIRHQATPGVAISSMLLDRRGQIWLGIDHKIFVYWQGRYVEAQKADGSPWGEVDQPSAFAEAADGDIWALSTSVISNQEDYLLDIRDGRVRQKIQARSAETALLAGDRRAGIWALSTEGELVHYIDGRVAESTRLVKAGSPFNVYELDVDSYNVVWASTSRGLYRWSDGRTTLLDLSKGSTCRSVQSMIEDDHGTHWLRASCGIVRITAAEWEGWLKSPESTISPTVFGPLDGARAGVRAGQSQPSIAKTQDGRIWFAANAQVQMIDPGRMPASLPPPVHIEQIIADHKTYEGLDKLKLPPLKGELQIDYTALTFKIPHRAQFRYKLEGHDEDWQEPGTRRQAFYSDLPPRKYRFRVTAANSDGVWNETGAALDFTILPAYYQTMWFRVLCGAALLLLACFLYQYRLRQMQQQFNMRLEAQVSERTRIARELHDTMLQSFQGLLLRFQTVANLLPSRPDEAKTRIDSVVEEGSHAITEGRDAVHELRSAALSTVDLAESIRDFARELPGNLTSGVYPELRVQVEGVPKDLNPVVRDEAYRIAGEALRNAIRHAGAKGIEVEIRYDVDYLRLRMRDDGKGIDASVLDKEHVPGHWGLRGMRERAKLIGGTFEIWSETGSGTEIELKIPAASAYAKPSASLRSFFSRS